MKTIRLAKEARLRFLIFLLCWASLPPAQAQLVNLLQMNSDGYEAHAPHLFERGQLAPYTSAMPDRPAASPADSLPAFPWVYEIDAGQVRHHLRRQGGWVWLVVSNNDCNGPTCPIVPPNLNRWLPFFDSLKGAGGFSVRYVTTTYQPRKVQNWRGGLDAHGIREPMLIISNEAHGDDTEQKARRFMRQLAPGKDVPNPTNYSTWHLLFDPQGQCVLVAAERELEPGPKGRDPQPRALTTEQIMRRAAALLRGG